MNGPNFNRAATQNGHHVGHLCASNQRHVLGVVVEGCNRLEHGDVEVMTGRPARVVGPNREQSEGHVHRGCSGNDAIGEGQAGRKRRHDGPVVHDAGVDGVEVDRRFVSSQGEVLRVVIQRNGGVVDGDVDKHGVGTARVVGPYGVHRRVLDDRWRPPNGAVG